VEHDGFHHPLAALTAGHNWSRVTDIKAAPLEEQRVSRAPRRADIQGIRALAVLLVVAFHAGLPVPGGYVGVDVFFVISGFVITGMLIREKRDTGRISLTTFYLRRFRRLVPALALMVLVVVAVSALPFNTLSSQRAVSTTAIGTMFLFGNIAIARSTGGYFDQGAMLNPLLHTWSLAVEEQFYLVFPVLLIAGWAIGKRVGRPRVGLFVAIVGLALASLAVALATSTGLSTPLVPEEFLGFYSPVGRAWEFAAGALLAMTASRIRPPSRVMARLLGAAAIVLLAFSVLAFDEGSVFPGPLTIIPVVATVLLIYIGVTPANPVSAVLASKPATALGDISYSWYLWHWPSIVFAGFLWPQSPVALLLAAALSVIPAIASYRLVEQPARLRLGQTPLKTAALVAATLVLPVALAGSLAFALNRNYWSPQVASVQATQQMHAGIAAGCLSYIPLTESTQSDCEWNADAPGRPVFLVGDSIAEHYSEAMIGATKNLQRPLFIATAGGCPLYTVELPVPGEARDEDVTAERCGTYIAGTLDWLEKQPAGIVVMGASDVPWWAPTSLISSETFIGTDDEIDAARRFASVPLETKKEAIRVGLESTAKRLRAAGHTVVIAQAPPGHRYPAPLWSPLDCSVATIMAGECHTSAPLGEVEKVQKLSREAVSEAASRSSAAVLDLRDYFCREGVCVTQRGDLGLYLDAVHISVPASRALVPRFSEFLAAQE
jgi:peptidoglycan/LPS O-acetylase OafA/YrhL